MDAPSWMTKEDIRQANYRAEVAQVYQSIPKKLLRLLGIKVRIVQKDYENNPSLIPEIPSVPYCVQVKVKYWITLRECTTWKKALDVFYYFTTHDTQRKH